jgi:conjugative transfer signal peptidase TraF
MKGSSFFFPPGSTSDNALPTEAFSHIYSFITAPSFWLYSVHAVLSGKSSALRSECHLKRKFAVFCVLITPLCLAFFTLAAIYSLGYRVNLSSSLPCFVYRITPIGRGEEIKPGDCVTINLSKVSNPVIELGAERGYVAKGWNRPMLKQIGALPGDTVELRDGFLFVNGVASKITVASQDSMGGKLAAWPTPLTLPPGQYWLVSDPERGFDSRYFGPIHRAAFTHKARPVFH